jgi:hypothetical protein
VAARLFLWLIVSRNGGQAVRFFFNHLRSCPENLLANKVPAETG